MQNKIEYGLESYAQDESINGTLEKIEALKEGLKYARVMSDEMLLLRNLNQEIIALRKLREPHY